MAWENTLLPASFRNVPFEVDATVDDIDRAVVVHEYPYVDGANVEDMGRQPRHIGVTAVLYGDDYELRLQQLLTAVDEAGAGELIHPVFGSVQVQCVRVNIAHAAERPDYAKVNLDFLEAKLRTPLFDRVLPSQQIDAVDSAADDVLSAAQTRFELDIGQALNLPTLLRDKLSADMLNVMGNMRSYADQLIDARGWLASGVFYLKQPVAFVDDLSSGLVSRVQALYTPMNLRLSYAGVASTASAVNGSTGNTGSSTSTSASSLSSFSTAEGQAIGYARGSLATVWKAPLAHLQQALLTLPSASITPGTPFVRTLSAEGVATQPFLSVHLMVQQASAIAAAAAALYSLDLGASVLTPADVETVASDARSAIASTITQIRSTYPDIVQARPLTEPLKALALTITVAAEKLIRAKPPLINRTVDSTGNLQLLAHLWYGDYRRADELLRLNPGVVQPNFVQRGAVLRAYAV